MNLNQKPFVLVVEDDQELREIIARNLRACGYFVFEAASFQEAVQRIAVKPQVMVLDINLPDATGWDVADWLESATTPVPIIVISGLHPAEERLRRFGVKAFLPKPFAIEELLDLVQEYAPVPSSMPGTR